MTNWQADYKKKLMNKTILELEKAVEQKTNTIRRADKRTHNGKLIKIFETANILVIEEVLKEKRAGIYV